MENKIKVEIDLKQELQIARFKIACEPLMEYLTKYHNPHTRVIIDCNSAELLSGIMAIDDETK